MMMLRNCLMTFVLGGILLAVGPFVPEPGVRAASLTLPQTQVNVMITGANGARPRLAVPEFTVAAGATAELQDAAKTMAAVLWDDLDFEDEYSMIPRADAAKIPITDSIEAIRYDLWRELGTDAVLLGTVRPASGGLEIEIRLIGTSRDASRLQVFGRKYGPCATKNPRFCAHYISDDFFKDQRRLDGVARTHLAFSSDRNNDRVAGRIAENNGQEIYMTDYDGASPQRLTANRSLNISPTWAPDGRVVAYASYVSHFPDIYIQSVYDVGRLTRPAGGTAERQNITPAFSPDGTKIAFASTRESSAFNVYVVNRDGSDLRRLTNSKLDDLAPAWSPTGSQIVFVSGRSGDAQLYLMNADGTGVEHLGCGEPHCDRPTWSPVLNRIAYTCGTSSANDICLIDMATRQIAKLTDGPGTNEQPSFAPNGRHVVFVTTRWGKSQLAIVDLKGNLKRRITDVGNNKYPTWSRSPQ